MLIVWFCHFFSLFSVFCSITKCCATFQTNYDLDVFTEMSTKWTRTNSPMKTFCSWKKCTVKYGSLPSEPQLRLTVADEYIFWMAVRFRKHLFLARWMRGATSSPRTNQNGKASGTKNRHFSSKTLTIKWRQRDVRMSQGSTVTSIIQKVSAQTNIQWHRPGNAICESMRMHNKNFEISNQLVLATHFIWIVINVHVRGMHRLGHNC